MSFLEISEAQFFSLLLQLGRPDRSQSEDNEEIQVEIDSIQSQKIEHWNQGLKAIWSKL